MAREEVAAVDLQQAVDLWAAYMSRPQEPLLRVDREFRPLLLAADRDATTNARLRWMNAGLVVRVVRGRKARTPSGVFDEFAAALQFPLYFGENWAAFDECPG